jgi:hypothetical protein
MLHVDILTLPEIRALFATRADACVSIYVSTSPQPHRDTASRIAFGNQTSAALERLESIGLDKRRHVKLASELAALGEDEAFWRFQAHSLAVLATPDSMRTFRLATAISDTTEVSDRFHLKPLLRAIAFPQTAFVLALSVGAVRLVKILVDLPPAMVRVPGLPKSAANAVKRASINDLTQNARVSNAEGQKILLHQYAQQVDRALRGVLSGRETPLMLAATEPLSAIFRAVNSYRALEEEGISTSPDYLSDHDLANASQAILDRVYVREVEAAKALLQTRLVQRRATIDIEEAARAATNGAIELLIVDIDHVVPGTVVETSGRVTRASTADASSYDIIGEIATRAILTGAKFLGVRRADIPGDAAGRDLTLPSLSRGAAWPSFR